MRSFSRWERRVLVCSMALACVLSRTAVAAEGTESRFSWQPSVILGAEATDNAKLAENSKQDDVAVRVRPRVTVSYQNRILDAGVDLGVDLRRHAQVGTLDKVFYRMSGHAEAGLLPGLTLHFRDDYVPSPIALGAPEDHDANLVQTNRAKVELRYGRDLGEQLELRLGVSGARFDAGSVRALVPGAAGAPVPGRFRADYWEEGGFLQLGRRFGERGLLFARGNARHRSFQTLSAASHSDFSGVLGAQLSPIAGLDLRLEGGGGVLDFEGGSREPRFTGRADLGYRTARWRLGLGVHRGVATDLIGNAFDNLAGRLVIERKLGSITRATLTGFASLLDAASQATQQDAFGGVELRVQRQLSREFSIEFSYRFWENAGSRSDNDFRQHRGYAQLRYAY